MARKARAAAREAGVPSPPPPSCRSGVEAETDRGVLECELSEVSTRLVSLDLADSTQLLEAAEDLARIAATNPSLRDAVRRQIEDAAIRIARIVQTTTRDPEAEFAEAIRSLDRAVKGLSGRRDARKAHARGQESAVGTVRSSEQSTGTTKPSDFPSQVPALTPGPIPKSPETIAIPPDADLTLIGEFVTECLEYISGAEAALLALESNPDEGEAINTVFRAFHTIKGTSGFLGFGLVTDLAHKAENLLSRARDHEIRCTGGYADLALQSVDTLKTLLEGIRSTMGGQVVRRPEHYDELIRILIDTEVAGVTSEAAQVSKQQKLDAAAGVSPDRVDPGTDIRGGKKTGWRADESSDSVRVRTDRLDRLIDMVGELVIAQSMVAQDDGVILGSRPDLIRKVTHAGKIVRELQDLTMSMRMVPLKSTFQKMARLVRDLAHKGGREIDFATSGEETEIDRNMVDVIGDPLVHMIRNAVDHGIEPSDLRELSGKSRHGRITLSAYHAGGNVVVELRDDGRGLDRAKITTKAVSQGLIESDKGMSDSEVFNLIFEPGFSTAEKVTEVSGRGVGMDVVRRSVLSLHGRIEIRSVLGEGTTFVVKLPLTLALTDGMLIRVGAQRYIVPTGSIEMSLRPEASALSTVIGRGEMVVLRGDLIPIIRLHRLFGIQGAEEDPSEALLVVVDDGERRSAVMVDELLGQQQVVAKSLGASIKVTGVAGGAILGDGRVGLILDPSGLLALARGQCTETGVAMDAIGA